MTTDIKLTATQAEIIKLATYRPDGNIEPLPPQLRGGARKNIIASLLTRALAVADGDKYLLTDAGYAAVGRARAAPATDASVAEIDAVGASVEALQSQNRQIVAPNLRKTVEGKPRTRDNSKQSTVILMLQRPEGATIPQVMAETGWLNHSARGFLAGTIKRKLGLNLVSEKAAGGNRVYRVQA